ncbi:MAG: tRNA uracil 4-sulfurtransferase ThiI [Candidatus Woesearchaeota archaeon]|jgi:thiamine biosynthesis protein ThiI
MYNCILLRPGELTLKGENRDTFERTLLENIRHTLRITDKETKVKKIYGGFILTEITDFEKVKCAMQEVFGLSLVCPAFMVKHDIEEVKIAAIKIINELKPENFKVETKRQYKKFEFSSMQINNLVGEYVINETKVKAKMQSPKCTIYVDVCDQSIFVYSEKLFSGQGLPVGCTGHVVVMISGGIDSPVSSYMSNKRGCYNTYLTFESFPFTSKQATEKVKELVRIISKYQKSTTLYIVPFTEVQKEIKAKCSEKNRTILYRRIMVRIANELATKIGAEAIVTGESLGQVASQTLINMSKIDDASKLMILRPLLTFDKQEIITVAEKIGTYKTSIQPFADCCTVFQPEKPTTRAKTDELEYDESKLDLTSLLSGLIEKAEIVKF